MGPPHGSEVPNGSPGFRFFPVASPLENQPTKWPTMALGAQTTAKVSPQRNARGSKGWTECTDASWLPKLDARLLFCRSFPRPLGSPGGRPRGVWAGGRCRERFSSEFAQIAMHGTKFLHQNSLPCILCACVAPWKAAGPEGVPRRPWSGRGCGACKQVCLRWRGGVGMC